MMDLSGDQRRSYHVLLVAAFFFFFFDRIPVAVRAGNIGFCYGRKADNLPSPQQVARLLVNQSIGRVRIYDYDQTVIQALANTNIELIISIPNEELQNFQTEKEADNWVNTLVAPVVQTTNIVAIAIGAEVVTTNPNFGQLVLPAMMNVHTGLTKAGLADRIRVSTPHSMGVLQNSFPPSASAFNDSYATTFIKPILDYLQATGSFFMINAYPYHAYIAESQDVALDYALFDPKEVVVDPTTNLTYTSLFDAQLDAVYFALEALGHKELTVMVTETGWPTKGGTNETGANVQNAATYNNNLVSRILNNSGSPHRPGVSSDAYIFSLFNEDLKTGPVSERNWGVYNADGSRVYYLDLTATSNGAPQSFNVTGGTWCVALPGASNDSLAAGLDYACGQGNANCGPIQSGQACYLPNTYQNHASYAYNSYYQRSGDNRAACNFSGTAMVTTTNPSYGSCVFPSDVVQSGGIFNNITSSVSQSMPAFDLRVMVIAALLFAVN